MKPELTAKEAAAIEELKDLGRRWPTSLQLGEDGKRFLVWKRDDDGSWYGMAKIPRIVNIGSFDD